MTAAPRLQRPARRQRRRRGEWAIAALLAALAFFVADGAWAWRLERVLFDFALSTWSRPAPENIVIVAIDDASINAIGRWPWPRAVHATLLDRLAAAKPRAIALDIVLSEPDPDPAQDRLLAAALTAAGPVVVPVSWLAVPGQALRPLEPVLPIRSAVHLGAAEAAVDADGVLRHAFLHSGPASSSYPHLALALLQAGGGAVHPAVRTEVAPPQGEAAGAEGRRDDRLLIRYAGPPGHFTRLSYVDVLSGAVPATALTGRFVIVGMTAQGLGDTLATPVNAEHHAMPGVEVLANTLYTLASGDALHSAPARSVGAVSAALVGLLVAGFVALGQRSALPLALGSTVLAVVAGTVALRWGLWFSPVPFAAAALLAYPLWSWQRLEFAVAEIDREIRCLAGESLGGLATAPSASASALRLPGVEGGDAIDVRLATLRAAGDTVQAARRFLADALAGMPTAMLVADEQARVLLANALAASLFEVEDAADLQGLDLGRLVGEFSSYRPLDWGATLDRLLAAGGVVAVEARLAEHGDYVLQLAAVELLSSRRLILTVADVEPVKRAQRQREEVLAFVSHDLRSPATSIVLLADMNLAEKLQTPREELLREMRRLAQRTLAMAEDFVRTAHAETKPLDPAPVTLAVLVEEAVADLRSQALAGGVELDIQVDEPGSSWQLDAQLVSRAIANLLRNAIRHSPRGGRVGLRTQTTAAELVLRVQDQGAGLTAQQREQIGRGQGLRAGDERGVGLGLLFVQHTARRHAGALRAEPAAEGSGSVIELRLRSLQEGDSGNP